MDWATTLALIAGTAAAAAIAYPLSRALKVQRLVADASKAAAPDPHRTIMDLTSLARTYRERGPAGMAQVLAGVRDPVVAKAMTMIMSGADAAAVRDALGPTRLMGAWASQRAGRGGLPACLALGGVMFAFAALLLHVGSEFRLGAGLAAAVVVALYASLMIHSIVGTRAVQASQHRSAELLHRIIVYEAVQSMLAAEEPTRLQSRLSALVPAEPEAGEAHRAAA